MKFVADLHIHSYLSRACSRQLRPEPLFRWSLLKGVTVLSTGDFTHPAWFAELKEKLAPAEPGLFRLRPEIEREAEKGVPASCRGPVRFLLGVEISSIYKRNGRVRRVHNLVFAPSFDAAAKINARLVRLGNLGSDGRPILGLDSEELLAIVLDAHPEACLIPAHAWTPHFGVFGSASGFDSLEECFGSLSGEIFAVETGLSSDPAMNWRLSALDRLTLISNSDAHSPEKLGREANLFEGELSYAGVFGALRRRGPARLLSTFEFFPEEGKYHADGHRKCAVRLSPAETARRGGLCPECGKPVTVGVLSRIESLADRARSRRPPGAPGFERLVALKQVLGELLGVGPQSAKIDAAYRSLLERFGPELAILRKVPLERLEREGEAELAAALGRMRRGRAAVAAGYDGEYGKVSLLGGARESGYLERAPRRPKPTSS